MRNGIEMYRLVELVRLHRMGTGKREMARLLGMSPNTERQYRDALQEAGLLDGAVEELPDVGTLQKAVRETVPAKTAGQQVSSIGTWAEKIEAMVNKGAEPKAIFDLLKLREAEFAGSLSAVKRMVTRIKAHRPVAPGDVAIPVRSAAGEIAQVDFGYIGQLYDAVAGVLRRAWVFVMVLAHSRHMFARVVFDQRTETWIRLHVEAFGKLGGVVETVVPDNLKAAVIRAAFGVTEDPALNRSYAELARYYGFKIDPTPPRAPEKKGRVESAVKYVKHNFFKPRDFRNADDAEVNAELDRWVAEIAGQRVHGSSGWRPLEVFATEEQAVLRALPARPYELIHWKRVRVHPDGQIVFERRPYPVPWRLIGRDLWARVSTHTVDVYWEQERVATHQRGVPVPPEIVDQYLPPERAPLRHRSRSFWLERADRLGEEVGEFIREIFDAEDVLSHLRTVQAIVTHLEKFPRQRARAACARARYFGNHTYRGVRDILKKALDREPLPLAIVPAPADQPAARPRFARTAAELLQLKLKWEDTDELQ
jgi:transposase